MSDEPVKRARPDHAIHPLIAERWSPYVYDPRPVEPDKLRSCLEAARWAASSYNEQPWFFLLATRDDPEEFERMLRCLVEPNQEWAGDAGALLITVVKRRFARNQRPNRVAEHDLGLAAGNLCLQATALGLSVHQMEGIVIEKARETYRVPEGHDPWTGIAIGYAAEPSRARIEKLAERDRAPRARRPLQDFVFRGGWAESAPLVRR
ncbi:MAG: nitroreductase family protein [Candidatus Binatia bacterium]